MLNTVEFVRIHAKYGRGAYHLSQHLDELHGWLKRLLDQARGRSRGGMGVLRPGDDLLRDQTLTG